MDKFIKICELLESKELFYFADKLDKDLIRLAKTPEGERLIEEVDWRNPELNPQQISKMESDVYPSGFHLFTDLEVPDYLKLTPSQQRLVPKPVRDKIIQEIRSTANEYLIEDDVDQYIIDGIDGVFYFILAVRSNNDGSDNFEPSIEVEDLTVIPGRRKINLFIALERLYKALKPYQDQEFVLKGDAREKTSWPMIRNMAKDGWLIPIKGKRIREIIKDEAGNIVDLRTDMRSVGGEMLHKFKFKMNLPDTFPEKFQMYADEGYKILKQKKSLLSRGLDRVRNILPK
jgi:hypothetical protein